MTEFPVSLAAAGINVTWLARMTGRPHGTVRRWVDGTASPPPELLIWLGRRLDDPPPAIAPRPPKPPMAGQRDHLGAPPPHLFQAQRVTTAQPSTLIKTEAPKANLSFSGPPMPGGRPVTM